MRLQSANSSPFQPNKNTRLYQALLFIYKFSKVEDLSCLKSAYFLDLCEITHIDWSISISQVQQMRPVPSGDTFKCPLKYQKQHYGHLMFHSNYKISKTKKEFLSQVTDFVGSALHYIETNKKLESAQYEWEHTFDCFYQALCITDQNFQILKVNQAICQLLKISKQKCIGWSFFKMFPFPIQEPPKDKYEYSWVSHSPSKTKNCSFEFSLKTIVLQNEKVPFKLLLVKNITKELEMEKRIAQKAKNKDIGLIKASIAHELNNPIAGIRALLYMIQQNLVPTNPELEQILKDMDQSLKHCQSIINNLLSVSHQNPKRSVYLNPK